MLPGGNASNLDGADQEVQHQDAQRTSRPVQQASPVAAASEAQKVERGPVAEGEKTRKIDRSLELWNDAYDQLEVEEETVKTASAYRETLAELLTNDEITSGPSTTATGTRIDRASRNVIKAKILEGLTDRSRRQEMLARFVKDGQEKAKTSKFVDRVGRIADTILQAKPAVDVVLHVPHAAPAALPWAGVCVCLKVSSYRLRDETITA